MTTRGGADKPTPSDDRVRKFERRVVEHIEVEDTISARAAGKRDRFASFKLMALWCGLWGLLVFANLTSRIAWPPDETRMLAIAWEMWSQGHAWLPTLNGELQLQPPLFFWLIHFGWKLFGVSNFWPQLVAPLGALASLFIIPRVARNLWSAEEDVARYSPFLLLGAFAFALFSSAILPLTWMVTFVLLAVWALLIMWRKHDGRAWLLLAAALSLGVLTVGLIMYAYILPIAFTAPLWTRLPHLRWRHWYSDVLTALGISIVAVALWLAIVAAGAGVQSMMRYVLEPWQGATLTLFSLEPQRWWYYAWFVPVAFLPWFVLPLAWMRLWYLRHDPFTDGFMFCFVWIMFSLVILSLLPVKQPQLLLPLLPASVLITSRVLFGSVLRRVYENAPLTGMAIPMLLFGGALMVLPQIPDIGDLLPETFSNLSVWIGIGVMAIGIAAAWLPHKDVAQRVLDTAAICILLVVFFLLGIAMPFNALYPKADVGLAIAEAQARGQTVAIVGDYAGEFNFPGRLRAPVQVVVPRNAVAWAKEHPDAAMVSRASDWNPYLIDNASPLFSTLYGDDYLRLFNAKQVLLPRVAPSP